MRDPQSFGQQIARGRNIGRTMRAVVFETGSGTAGVELPDGVRLRRVASGSGLAVGDVVDVEIGGNGARVITSGDAAGSSSSTVLTAPAGAGGALTGAPSPHDLLGAHHTLPTLSPNLVLASLLSGSGQPSFRALGVNDLPAMTIGAGNGLTGGGDVRGNPTLNVAVANTGAAGLTVEADAVRLTSSSSPGAAASILASDANGFLTLPQFLATTKVRTPLIDTASGALTLTPATGVVLTDGKTIGGSTTFVSGFAGAGWRVDQGVSYAGQATAEFDNLVVRGLLRVYELVINKIRVSRGSMIVSPGGGKVATVSGSGPYTLAFDDDHGLAVGDLLRAQKFTGSGTYLSLLAVTAVPTGTTATVTLSSGVAPAAGYEYAVVGNSSNTSRQGGLFLTADDSGAPFMDIYDGVAAHADFNTSGKTKTRIGKLTGITDSFFGTLAGYGFYGNRVYINGGFINGSLIIGPGVGFSVPALMHCAFDTPRQGNAVNTNGHKGQVPTITGGVSGMMGKFSGAVAVGEATTNRILNPSIETNTTGYASDGTVTLSRSSEHALFGQYSLKWVYSSGSANVYYNVSGTLAASTTLTFSVYVRRLDGGVVSGLSMYLDSSYGTLTPTITPVGNGWYRVYGTRAISALGNHIVGLTGMATNTQWFFDGWQVEARAYTTPYVDGSLGSGYAWTGTAHASTSSRTAAVLAYPINNTISPVRGSVSMWILMEYYKVGLGGVLWNAGDANGEFQGQVSAAGSLQLYINGNTVTHQTQVPAGWHHVAFTWDVPANTMRVYLDGVPSTSAGTPSTTLPTLHPSTIQIGGSSLIGTTYNHNSLIDDFAILDRALTADEITAIYNSNAPLNVSRSNYELMLTEDGYGKVIANAAGIYGTDTSNKPTFSLVNAGTTVNGEVMTAGDTMLGDNSSGKGNVLFDQSTGALNIRAGTTNILSFSSAGVIEGAMNLGASGGIYQGSTGSFSSVGTGIKIWRGNGTTDGGVAGDCIIGVFDSGAYTMSITPSNAITIVGGTGYEGKRALSFVQSNGTKLGEVYSYTDGSTYNAMRIGTYSNSSSRSPVVYVDSKIEAGSGTATAQLIASKFVQSTIFYDRPRAVVSNTVNVGTPSATVTLEVYSKTGSSATAALTDNNGTTSFVVTAGSKSWRIDHPLRPTTHWLDHVAVEGDGHFTFYRGNVVLDARGRAVVQMPNWFDALNEDLAVTYGAWGEAKPGERPARTLDLIPNGWIITGEPHAKVSWIATGKRRDPWAAAHPFTVEVEKEESHQGTVYTWMEHGLDESFAPPSVLDVNPAPAGQ
jgi:hypothetical protein